MCFACSNTTAAHELTHPSTKGRRRLLKTMAIAPFAGLLPLSGTAKAQNPLPKPENALSPDQALARLMAGNERYVKGDMLKIDVAGTRAALSGGQNPFACLVSCADSRIGPEFCFDEERGDLFVTRVAGNFVNTDILASLEYGTEVLGASLIMVLGHSRCGAIEAAVKAFTQNMAFPGHIQSLTTALAPAVRAALSKSKDDGLVTATTVENVRLNVIKLQESNPIIRQRVAQGRLRIVGGIYDLPTGRVRLI